MTTVLETYARFAAGLRTAPLSDEVRHHAERAIVDWFAACVPGGVMAPATLVAEALADQVGAGNASLVPGGQRATAQTAALINGTASHTVEFDDIFREGLYHPGTPTISAALAAAELAGADGARLLAGVVAGYEVSNRIAKAVNPRHYDYWHTTATVGCFGAAAAASVILDLDAGQTAHALGTAATMAAGLQQAFRADAMSKPLHSGRAAEAGVLAARLAKAGVTGALDALEGPRGFGAAMSGPDVDWEAATATLGSDWTITRVTFKNHAACGHVHAAVDAAAEIAAANGLTFDRIARIEAGSYAKSVEICGNAEPVTAFEAKFSLPYCVAAVLVRGSVRRAAFDPDALADPAIRDLAAKVVHTVDPGCEAAFPGARSARVAIVTTDGRRFEHFAPTRKGDPDNPLTDAELDAKFHELTDDVLGAAVANDLLARLRNLRSAGPVGDLLQATALPHAAE
ncbi:MmgE/PrpD family protein [Thalassobaculum sp.]|uniref:MmgE/PrpD family protein n=1 Tax=Thalassobaculum sp. TaxID=2022740 RepID=UPI003B5B5889